MRGKHFSRKINICSFNTKKYPHSKLSHLSLLLPNICVLPKATWLTNRVSARGSVSSPQHICHVQSVIPGMLKSGWKCLTVALNKYRKNSEHKFFLGKYNDLKAIRLTYIFRKCFNHLFHRECW